MRANRYVKRADIYWPSVSITGHARDWGHRVRVLHRYVNDGVLVWRPVYLAAIACAIGKNAGSMELCCFRGLLYRSDGSCIVYNSGFCCVFDDPFSCIAGWLSVRREGKKKGDRENTHMDSVCGCVRQVEGFLNRAQGRWFRSDGVDIERRVPSGRVRTIAQDGMKPLRRGPRITQK